MSVTEKVIKGLHDARRYLEDKEWSDRGSSPHIDSINDALALLKEQKSDIEKLNGFINGFSRDAIPVVRCKDCINCVKEPNGELYCDILAVGYEPLGSKKVDADWFCADGERQEGR